MVPDVTRVVPGVRLAERVAKLAVQAEGLLAAAERHLVVAERRGVPAQVRQRVCLPGPVPDGPVEPQRVLGVPPGGRVLALLPAGCAQEDAAARLPGLVAELPEPLDGPPGVGGPLVVASQRQARPAHAEVGVGATGPVPGAAGRLERGPLGDREVVPVALAIEE